MDESLSEESSNSWIKLNVGGRIFLTTRSTIAQCEPNSMLAKLVASYEGGLSWRNKTDESGAILIDRSPQYFEPIINYLRCGKLIIDKNVNINGVLEEARFYGIDAIQEELTAMIRKDTGLQSLTRADAVKLLAGSVSGSRIRLQGLDFSNADLSQLDLSGANLSYSCLSSANLHGANLNDCILTRTDCTSAIMDKATMSGVQMRCATLDKASLTGVFLEATENLPAANLEGSSLKDANLENSHLQEVNLRVACLKGARLTGCNLRSAVLAGSDLENADLSGCDLQQANLRGANVINCEFGDLRSPLHMAQTLNTLRG